MDVTADHPKAKGSGSGGADSARADHVNPQTRPTTEPNGHLFDDLDATTEEESDKRQIGQSDLNKMRKDILQAIENQFKSMNNRVDDLTLRVEYSNKSLNQRIDNRVHQHVEEILAPTVNEMMSSELAPRDLKVQQLRNEVKSLRQSLREMEDM